MGRPVRTPSRALWNEKFHKTLEKILVDISATNGCVWLLVLRKLVLHSSTTDGLSGLNRLRLLLDGDFLTLWVELLLLMQPNHTPPQTTLHSRRHRQGRAVLLAHQGCFRHSRKALTSTRFPLAPASVWSEASSLFSVARELLSSERRTATLHDCTPPMPTLALVQPDTDAVRKLINSLPNGKYPCPSGLRSDHLTQLPVET